MPKASSTAGIIELRGSQGPRAPLIVGVAFLIAAALFGIAGGTPTAAPHALGVGAVAAIGILLAYWGRPRVSVVRIDPARRTVAVPGSAAGPVGEGAKLRLGPVEPAHPSGPSRYGVSLERPEGPAVPLLDGEDPEDVLRRLLLLRARLPLPVVGGWGLSAGAPWVDEAGAPAPPAPERRASTEGRDARQRITTTLMVGATAVGLILALELRGPSGARAGLRLVSVLLPAFSIALLWVVALAVRTDEKRRMLGTDFVAERRMFGLTWNRQCIPRSEIRGAHLVSPDGRTPRHLLLDTDDGPRAFSCEPAEGEELRATLATGAPR